MSTAEDAVLNITPHEPNLGYTGVAQEWSDSVIS